ncbi:hypothetical protein [Endozoicomonas lisbonensis]|uniref:Uncharacterized protein n=1 Tax=Endozoicomonas lisbonensis TaxID=3120522 RepID=A0ABV2SJB1_9GAMM
MDGQKPPQDDQAGEDGNNGSTENQYFVAYGEGSNLHSLLQATDKEGATAGCN